MRRFARVVVAIAVSAGAPSACAPRNGEVYRADEGVPQPGMPAYPYPYQQPQPQPAQQRELPQPGGATFARYARMDRPTCEQELSRRGVLYVRAEETPGVLAPVRLRGPLSGVSIHSGIAAKQRDKSPYEIFDCRLVLALDDFSALLAWRGITEMIHMSAYRPQAENGCTPRYIGKQHCAALAVDVGMFKRRDGVVLNVEKDFHGRIGQETCGGSAAPSPPSAASSELWSWICEATRRSLFNVILTPNYNAQHRNHFHLEVTPDAEWMLVK